MSERYIYRSGIGYDVHKVIPAESEDNTILLGGVYIKHNKSVVAHSDGDVLLHAVMDAILGACALNDIGYYFPPSNDKYKDTNSGDLLKEVMSLITDKGFELINVDSVIMCESPKILPHRDSMRQNIAELVGLPIGRIGVKATTTEKLGFIGREEGIAVQAVSTVKEYYK